MPTIILYRFKYFDPMRGKWLLARYACGREQIERHYPEHQLIEPPEVRHVPDDPHANSAAHLARPWR
jgi:hypothetical protein